MLGGSAHRPGYVLSGLGRFGRDQGLGPNPPLGAEVVEAFVAVGLPGRAPSTKGTYRSVLRAIGGPSRPASATPFSGSATKAPYGAQERAELLSVATSQRSEWRRGSALMLLALGIGAGLRAGELAAAIGDDVTDEPRGVCVRVGARAGAPCLSTTCTQKPLPYKHNTLGRAIFSARAGPTGATRTSSTTSATAWMLTPPPRGYLLGVAVPASSATTWRQGHLCGNCFI